MGQFGSAHRLPKWQVNFLLVILVSPVIFRCIFRFCASLVRNFCIILVRMSIFQRHFDYP
jgi:hypothetical protein